MSDTLSGVEQEIAEKYPRRPSALAIPVSQTLLDQLVGAEDQILTREDAVKLVMQAALAPTSPDMRAASWAEMLSGLPFNRITQVPDETPSQQADRVYVANLVANLVVDSIPEDKLSPALLSGLDLRTYMQAVASNPVAAEAMNPVDPEQFIGFLDAGAVLYDPTVNQPDVAGLASSMVEQYTKAQIEFVRNDRAESGGLAAPLSAAEIASLSEFSVDEGGLNVAGRTSLAGSAVEAGVVDDPNGIITGSTDIDDLLGEGRDWGLRAGYRHGNNGYGSGRTFAGAWRHSEEGGDRQFGLLAAASSSRSSEYATAHGQKNDADPGSQQPRSWLLKARLQPSDQHRLDLSHMRYENDFYHNYPWQISARNQRAGYRYTPYTPWIDLRASFATNKTRLFYPPVEDASYIGRRTHSSLSSWNIDNTSRFEIGALQARWNTGIKHQSDIFAADTPTLRGANPQGRSQLDSVFSTLELQYDIYALTAGLRQDRYGIHGHIPACSDVPGQCAEISGGGIDVGRRQHAFSPSLAVSLQATDWLQVFAEVSRTSRPPRVQEMFFEKIPLEGMSDADGVGANPFLRRERSRNLQFGANLSTGSLLVEGDLAQLRVTRFDNRIRDYIKPQYLLIVHPPEVEPFVVPIDSDPQLSAWTDTLDVDDFSTTTRWMNHPGVVRMRGIELEAHYASEHYHATLSWTRSHTSAPAIEFVNLEDITALPDRYWTLDVGGRWWQQRVQAGLRAEYSGPTEEGYDFFQTRKTGGTGVLLDFYASFKPQANTTLWLNIENLQDKAYDNNASIDSIFSPILDRGNGRGRTVSMGVTVAF